MNYKPRIGDIVRYYDPRIFTTSVGVIYNCSVNSKLLDVGLENDREAVSQWSIDHVAFLFRLTVEEMVTHDHSKVRIAGQKLIRQEAACSKKHDHRRKSQ